MRTIDGNGKQLGVVSLEEALSLAERQGLDLVEVAPQSQPPVCRIMDYGKYRYEQTKKVKEAKKKQHAFKVKEVKLRPNIDTHDYETKLNHAKAFLGKGYKLKVTIVFHGREITHRELGVNMLDRFLEDVKEYGSVEMRPKSMGRSIITVVSPSRTK